MRKAFLATRTALCEVGRGAINMINGVLNWVDAFEGRDKEIKLNSGSTVTKFHQGTYILYVRRAKHGMLILYSS